MPNNKEKFLEKVRRRLTNNTFTNEDIDNLKSEGLLNELFIENKNLSLLMHFIKNNDFEKVKLLLNEPYSVKTNVLSYSNHLNALTIAINEACINPDFNLQIIDELLKFDAKAQLLQRNKFGVIPLHFAAEKGHLIVVQKLLQHYPHDQLQLVDNVNHDTVSSCAVKSKNYQLIKWLFDTYPETLNDVLKDGFTLLHLACRLGDMQLVNIILERGDQKKLRQAPNLAGRIPLIVACTHGHLDVAAELLKINPSKQLAALDRNGHNAFHAACLVQSESFLKLFLQAAKPEYLQLLLQQVSAQGYTPLKLSIVLSKENAQMLGIVRLLMNAGAKITMEMFLIVIKDNNYPVFEELLNHGFDLNTPDQTGVTPLYTALNFKKPKMVALLLMRGADANLTIQDITGKIYTPLLMACYGPDFESIKLLKHHGALTTKEVEQFVIKNHGQKQHLYKQLREVLPDLSDLTHKSETAKEKEKEKGKEKGKEKEKENVPEIHTVSPSPKPMTGRQFLLSQGHSVTEIENMRKPANITPSWGLYTDKETKPEKVVFLEGRIDSDHEAIVPIENSQCYCYLDMVALQKQGLNSEDLKISRFKFSPANIKILDKDKGVYQDTIRLFAGDPAEKIQYTHELKISDVDRILLFPKGRLLIGIKFVPGGLHTQAQIHALHDSNRESHAPLDVHWPELTPLAKFKGMSSTAS